MQPWIHLKVVFMLILNLIFVPLSTINLSSTVREEILDIINYYYGGLNTKMLHHFYLT